MPGPTATRYRLNLGLYAVVALLAIASSAAVGSIIPRHLPRIQDEFAYLLAGQTFARFELTNPSHPLWEFFEAPHTLVRPTHMAKYPPGQGLVLAIGIWLGDPIYGVWLSGAFLAVSVTWMLRGFYSRRWALLGGLLTILQFGLAYPWAQTFWGAALPAAGGALAFGGARRICRRQCARDAVLLGAGAVILLLTRPFEGVLACVVPAGLTFARWIRGGLLDRSTLRWLVIPCGSVLLAGAVFIARYNERVTGSPWRLPYTEYESQYSGAPLFIWQKPAPAPAFRNAAMQAFYQDYILPSIGSGKMGVTIWAKRLSQTAHEFLGAVLLGAAVIGLVMRRSDRWLWLVLSSLALVAAALGLCYWFGTHYQAPAAPLYLFLAVAGTRSLFLALPRHARHFLVLLALLLPIQYAALGMDPSRAAQAALQRLSTHRQNVIDALQKSGSRYLILIQQAEPFDIYGEWVSNDVPIDSNLVVWAWDRGPTENRRLFAYFHDRQVLVLSQHGARIEFNLYDPGPGVAPTPR